MGFPVNGKSDRLLIGSWHSFDPRLITEEKIQELKDCGVDFIHTYYVQREENIRRICELCDRADLYYLPMDAQLCGGTPYLPATFPVDSGTIEEKLEKHLERYARFQCYAGTTLMDEPSAANFEHLKNVREIYRRLAPGKCAFMNLFPDYAPISLLNGNAAKGENEKVRDYGEYLDLYIKTVSPDFLSIDYYPFLEMPSGGDRLAASYLNNLDHIAAKCRETGLLFWFFIQCTGFNHYYKIPTETEINFQMYTALAFGMRVLQLFCYVTPPNVHNEYFYYAMLDPYGNKTPIYGSVQNLIRRIRLFDGAFCRYRNTGVMRVVGEDQNFRHTFSGVLENFPPIKSVHSTNSTLIGCFEHETEPEKTALLVTNFRLPDEGGSNTVTLHLNAEAAVVYTDHAETVALPNGVINLTLPSGSGAFIELKPF